MKKEGQVRVRFAPSPTGHLHIGGARTALFNWLFARGAAGAFILRIEDTDRTRTTPEAISAIVDGLSWLGIDWNEGPYYQSRRQERYREMAEKLLSRGQAYEEKGKLGSQPAIIFKVPDEKISFIDRVYGRIEFDTGLLDDLVLLKSDGSPAYNFACVVDDTEMEISHIIRGEDHISNTPKQLVLYRALELEPPEFVHVPLILGPDRSRLSKRHGATSLFQYREDGFLPEAMMNYLALLGWSSGDDQEIFSREELIGRFSLGGVSRSGAVFDQEKLKWMNGYYIRHTPAEKLLEAALPFLKGAGFDGTIKDSDMFLAAIGLVRERVHLLSEIPDAISYLVTDNILYDDKAVKKHLSRAENFDLLEHLAEKLRELKAWDSASIEECVRSCSDERGVKASAIIHPTRVAVTGRKIGPGLFELIDALGREKTLSRLTEAVKRFKDNQE